MVLVRREDMRDGQTRGGGLGGHSPRTVSGSRGKSREEWELLTLSTPGGRAGFEQREQRIRVGETETRAGLPPPQFLMPSP